MNRAPLLAVLSVFLTFSPTATTRGGSITYNIQIYPDNQSGYTLSGTITTDGTIGTLTAANITAWSWSVTGPSSYEQSSQTPTAAISYAVDLTATATSITLGQPPVGTFSGLSLLTSTPAAELVWYRSDDFGFDIYACGVPNGNGWYNLEDNPPGLILGGNTWIIATASVPEPGTFSLSLLGIACLAMAQRTMPYRKVSSNPQKSPTART
jgi:hypothetical protein